MKKFLFGIVLFALIFCSKSFAGVTSEILKTDIDDNGNIRVYTQYKIDGTQIISSYQPIEGQYFWVTRYSFQNFIGMTDEEIKAFIREDIKKNAEHFIVKKFVKDKNAEIAVIVNGMVSETIASESAEIKISEDQAWSVKTDGTKTNIDTTADIVSK